MSDGQLDVDRIVREVLARLPLATSGNGTAAMRPAAPGSSDTPSSTSELVLAQRVVTLDVLAGRLQGVRRLGVLPRAVITPAARDYLRQQGVTIGYVQRHEAAESTSPLVIGTAESDVEPSLLLDSRWESPIQYEQIARAGLVVVVDELTERVARDGRLGVLLTDAGAAAVCLANRRGGVRAILATGTTAVARARASIAANLLVIEPAGRNRYEIRQMLKTFTASGNYACSEAVRQRLA